MTAYKFLARGAAGPISGFAWPVPRGAAGAWIEVEGPLALCARGVHVCRAGDLAHWLHDELWVVEVDGDQIEGIDCIVVRRARLVRRVDGWIDGGASRLAKACLERAAGLAGPTPGPLVAGILDDARMAAEHGFAAVTAFSAALAVARLGDAAEAERSYRDERSWQSAWIAREILAA
jgi:hypothetical protein